MKKLTLLFYAILFLSSCVPNKDLVYLQGEPIPVKEIHKMNITPYKLQVDDIIIIDMKSSDSKLVALFSKGQGEGTNTQAQLGASYFNGYTVDLHGNIRVPYIGEINVLGYTTKEVRKKIEEELSKFFKKEKDYFVSVKLDGIRYTVFGEVVNPGPKVIYQNKVSIIDAVSNAGDITVTGNKKKVEIIRFSPSGKKKYIIDLTKIDAIDSEVFYIKPNDYINVVPLKQKSWGTGTTGLQSITTIISVFTLVTSTILLVRGL
ncbi:MAG: polysaccharide biosynthesis/export family protein [Flavobacteriaceae bacterium]